MFGDARFHKVSAGGALIFAALLIGAVVLHHETVTAALDNQARETLDQQWAAMMGYLRVAKNSKTVAWYYDSDDADEATNVRRLQRYFMFADPEGRLLEVSDGFEKIGIDSPSQIRSQVKAGKVFWFKRNAFLVRAGVVFYRDHRSPYYMAIATPVARGAWISPSINWSLAGVIACALVVGLFLGRMFPQIR
jgi:hypothetical protein